ncbi:putative Major facilitator superfamily domain-containing protein [Seiridium cardinale]
MASSNSEKTPQGLEAGSSVKEETAIGQVPEAKVHDPEDPYNWPTQRKIIIAVLLSFGQLVTLMTASMMAAALDQISADLHMSGSLTQMSFSVYILGLGFGPFIIGPMSEVYGRRHVWIACNIWYILWNSLCPVGWSAALMIVGRLLAGLGAASGVTLTGPVLTDMFRAKDRGKSLAVAGFIPYLGPALGPILGGLVAQHLYWGWFFWIMSIFDALVVVIGLFVLKETCTVVLQRRKQPVFQAGLDFTTPARPFTTAYLSSVLTPIRTALMRPIQLLLFRPLIFFISFNFAINFAMYFLVLSTFATLYIDRYGESESISSLHYFAIAIGAVFATQAGGPLMDLLFRYQKAQSTGRNEENPEFRVPLMALGAAIFPVGLLWQGWAAETRAHWAVVDAGAMVFTFASFVYSQSFYAYLLDEFKHTASANAAVRMFSYLLAFVFPLFATQLYDRLGYGWGNTLLALVFIVLGFPSVAVLWFWGPKLRALGKKEESD